MYIASVAEAHEVPGQSRVCTFRNVIIVPSRATSSPFGPRHGRAPSVALKPSVHLTASFFPASASAQTSGSDAGSILIVADL